jgi:ArsR family transcriptional regulator
MYLQQDSTTTNVGLKKTAALPVGKEIDITSRAMKALSHPVRLLIIKHLAKGELSVTDLTARITTHSQSSISQHLGYLLKNDIVSNRRAGTQHFYKINDWRTGLLIRMIMETFCPASTHRTDAYDHYSDAARSGSAETLSIA